MPNEFTTQPDEQAIRDRAYELWEMDGRQSGHDLEYWYRAVVERGNKEHMDQLVEPAPEAPRLN